VPILWLKRRRKKQVPSHEFHSEEYRIAPTTAKSSRHRWDLWHGKKLVGHFRYKRDAELHRHRHERAQKKS